MKEVRVENKLKQEHVAEICECEQGTISNIERMNKFPSNKIIKLFCNHFGINRHWLWTGKGEKQLPGQTAQDLLQVDDPAAEKTFDGGIMQRDFEDLKKIMLEGPPDFQKDLLYLLHRYRIQKPENPEDPKKHGEK